MAVSVHKSYGWVLVAGMHLSFALSLPMKTGGGCAMASLKQICIRYVFLDSTSPALHGSEHLL